MTKKVYLGMDNPTRVTFFRDGSAMNFSGVTKLVVTMRENNISVDSSIDTGKINFAIGNGHVDFYFGDIGATVGTYSLRIVSTSANGDEIIVDYPDNLQFNFVQPYTFDLVIQDVLGTETDATSYITVEYFKTYHNVRGNDFSGYDDFEIKQAIVRAFDYIDSRFKYASYKLNDTQNSEWPRYGYDVIPRAIMEAQAEYALRALSIQINPDPENTNNGRLVVSKSEGVGPLAESYTYDQNSAGYVMPSYPVADKKIEQAGLLYNSSAIGNVTFLTRG